MRYILLVLFIPFFSFIYGQKTMKTIIDKNVFTDLNGIESTLTDIFKLNKGKVIYIDFWASWCAPCKKEMPASIRLNKKLEGEDIKFIYISIDQNEIAWKKSMNKMKIEDTGQHYRRNQKDMVDFLKFFYIYSIPHYMLIGKNGQIKNRAALPPSNNKLERQIRKLLKEQ